MPDKLQLRPSQRMRCPVSPSTSAAAPSKHWHADRHGRLCAPHRTSSHRTAPAFGVVLWCSALLSHLLCSSTAGKVASRWVIDHQPDGTFKVTTATGATATTAAATQPERRETTAAAAAAAAAAPLCWDYSATDPEGNRRCTGCLNLGACCLSFKTDLNFAARHQRFCFLISTL